MSDGIRSRITRQAEMAPEELLAHPLNAKRHDQAHLDLLANGLQAVGFLAPVTVSEESGRILNGHGRVAAASMLGMTTVPVQYVALSDGEEAIVLATFDALGEMAVLDESLLNRLLREAENPAFFADIDALSARLEQTQDTGRAETAFGLEEDDGEYTPGTTRQVMLTYPQRAYEPFLEALRELSAAWDKPTAAEVVREAMYREARDL